MLLSLLFLVPLSLAQSMLRSSVPIELELANPIFQQFVEFQKKFNKVYDSLDEMQSRFEIFRENLRLIEEHNAIPFKNFTLAVNRYADYNREEFRQFVGGYTRVSGARSVCKPYQMSGKTLPDSIDWVSKGKTTPPPNQQSCGSCYSFSATGAIESAWAITKGPLIVLSEQEILDCATPTLKYQCNGCNGGSMDGVFKYVMENGQCTNASYPYTSGTTDKTGKCNSGCTPVVSISGCYDIEPNNQLALKDALSFAPVSIAVDASSPVFQFYKSGVITSANCGTNLDHGILAVSFGEESGLKYIGVRNSWGTTDWGMGGYAKIERTDSTNDPGICGFAMEPSFPVV
jgi:C1A family cysteine protease